MLKSVLFSLLSATLVSSAASAGTATGKLDIQLDVLPGCAFSGGVGSTSMASGFADSALSFGRITGQSSGSVDGQAVSTGTGQAMTVVCSSTFTGIGAPQLTIDAGLNTAAGGVQRRMAGPGGSLVAYDLFQDQGRNVSYDPGKPMQLAIPTAGVTTPVFVFGRVANVTGLPDGHYTDTVTLTLTY